MTIIICDNGNKQTKGLLPGGQTIVYESSYFESADEPLIKEKLIKYNNKYYSVNQGKRVPVQFDKSMTDDTWILTLPIIGETLKKKGIKHEPNAILAVGLPLSAYRNVEVQIFDLGGYTSDGLLCRKDGKIELSKIRSKNNGVITLLSDIADELRIQDISLTETQIQDIILKDGPIFVGDKVVKQIEKMAYKYVSNMLQDLIEEGFTAFTPTIFVGGGAMLLERFINELSPFLHHEVKDQYANCRGYKLLVERCLMEV